MVTYTKDNGKKIRQTALENTHTLMELCMKENGLMTSSMEKVRKNGRTDPLSKASMLTVLKKDSELSIGLTVQPIQVDLGKIKSTVLEPTCGVTSAFTRATGKTTKCTVRESLHGSMVEDTKVSTTMTKSMVKVFLHGQMVKSTRVTGSMENNMDMDFIGNPRTLINVEVNGSMERE